MKTTIFFFLLCLNISLCVASDDTKEFLTRVKQDYCEAKGFYFQRVGKIEDEIRGSTDVTFIQTKIKQLIGLKGAMIERAEDIFMDPVSVEYDINVERLKEKRLLIEIAPKQQNKYISEAQRLYITALNGLSEEIKNYKQPAFHGLNVYSSESLDFGKNRLIFAYEKLFIDWELPY